MKPCSFDNRYLYAWASQSQARPFSTTPPSLPAVTSLLFFLHRLCGVTVHLKVINHSPQYIHSMLSPSTGLPPTNSFCPWQGPACVVTPETPCVAVSMTPGDRHLKPAHYRLDGALDRAPGLAESEGIKSKDGREGEREGSQEVGKDSSALSHQFNWLRLYHCFPPEGVFQLRLIKSPWARCLGQVFKHKGESILPLRLFLPNATALISPLVTLILRQGQIMLVSASLVNGQMSWSRDGTAELSSTVYRTWQLHREIIDLFHESLSPTGQYCFFFFFFFHPSHSWQIVISQSYTHLVFISQTHFLVDTHAHMLIRFSLWMY